MDTPTLSSSPAPDGEPRANASAASDALAARLERLQRRLAALADSALAAEAETRRQRAAGRRP